MKKNIIAICMAILLSEHLLYVVPNNPWFPLVSLILCVFIGKGKIIYTKKFKSLYRMIITLCITYLISMVYTIVLKIQPIYDAITKYYPISLVTAIFFLLNLCHNQDKNNLIVRCGIEWASVITGALYLLQSIVYPKIIILTGLSEVGNGVRTVSAGILLAIGFLLLFENELTAFNFGNSLKFLLVLYGLIFVNRSRSLLFATGVAALVILNEEYNRYIKHSGVSGVIKKIVKFVILIIGLYFLTNLVMEIVGASIQKGESSSVNRIGAYKYYFDLFLKHPLFGIGYVKNQSVYGYAQSGVSLRYYIDDIGIVGFIAQFGLLGVLIILVWYKYVLKNIDNNSSGGIKAVIALITIIQPFNCIFNINALYMSLIVLMALEERYAR